MKIFCCWHRTEGWEVQGNTCNLDGKESPRLSGKCSATLRYYSLYTEPRPNSEGLLCNTSSRASLTQWPGWGAGAWTWRSPAASPSGASPSSAAPTPTTSPPPSTPRWTRTRARRSVMLYKNMMEHWRKFVIQLKDHLELNQDLRP